MRFPKRETARRVRSFFRAKVTIIVADGMRATVMYSRRVRLRGR